MSDLVSLARIAKVLADRDLSELARAQAEAEALRSSAQALRNQQFGEHDILMVARWDTWRNAELKRLEEARAKAAAKVYSARKAAQKSFGRCTALEELSKN